MPPTVIGFAARTPCLLIIVRPASDAELDIQDLDDWPREHERAADVRRALAVLESALHISVAIDPNKFVGLNIRL